MKLDDQTHANMPRLPPRRPDSHKGDYGRALVVGGSRGMSGAIALAGRATLRSGAGLVTLAVPRCVQDVVASLEPSYMTHALADLNGHIAAPAADEVAEMARNSTVVAIGPGLSRDPVLTQFVARLYREIDKPMIVDADGLFALAETFGVLGEPGGVRVLTPHPGEFARFTKQRLEHERRIEAAAKLAERDSTRQTIVVLKGHETVVTDGRRYSINRTGNPGMATGGAGDVLTGIITGLMCQGMEAFDAARLGTHLHGLAGDLAVESVGDVSMIAGDLIDYLPVAFQTLGRT
ncbi:MAG: NAD(P)H-hydrate dehydratase [Planctomycetes bacterium]|nr:NAD(P)H-hydrate dehydratase [Planctomycetota bacterium]